MTFRHLTLEKKVFFLARNRLFANLSYKDRGERLSYLLMCHFVYRLGQEPMTSKRLNFPILFKKSRGLLAGQSEAGCNFCPDMCH